MKALRFFKIITLCMAIVSFMSACATYQDLAKKSQNSDALVVKSETEPYPLNLDQMKTKVHAYFNRGIFDGPTLITSGTYQDPKNAQKLEDAMNEGFIYKEKFYTSSKTIAEAEQSFKEVGHFAQAKYHMLEDTPTGFLAVKGNLVIEVWKDGENQSKVKVSKFTALAAPKKYAWDWFSALQGKGLYYRSMKVPPDFIMSQKYLVTDKVKTLDFFKFVDPARAQ